jgi:CheY-like chemotaxis protein
MENAPDGPGILIVDDDESTRLLIGRIVTQELGAHVTLAGTGAEALRLAETSSFDIILLDLLMPGMGGYEVLRQLRERGANRETPVLVVSVMSTPESIERCRQLGATSYVPKPIDRYLVTTAVRSLLEGRRASGGAAQGAKGVDSP